MSSRGSSPAVARSSMNDAVCSAPHAVRGQQDFAQVRLGEDPDRRSRIGQPVGVQQHRVAGTQDRMTGEIRHSAGHPDQRP
jgi:hypothetical protein